MLPPSLEHIIKEIVGLIRDAFVEHPEEFPDLFTAEKVLQDLLLTVGHKAIKAFIEVQQEAAKRTRPMCSCDRPLPPHQTTIWERMTPFGKVAVRDEYAYCRKCGDSARPLHAFLGTGKESCSLLVEEAAVDLATDESCGKAVEKLAKHYPGVEMHRTAALRLLHKHGSMAKDFIEEKMAQAQEEAGKEGRQRDGAMEIEVELDGGMVPVATLKPVAEGEVERTPVRGLPKRRKDCRWEEVRLGVVQVPGEVSRLYTARKGELDELLDDIFALAHMKGLTDETQVRGIADGAIYIRPRMEAAFPENPFCFILDRPHCKEHLHSAGQALEPLTGVPADQWAEEALVKLEEGRAAETIAELRVAFDKTGNDTLRLEANYFERNADAVLYKEYREKSWSTASSEVESGHRHVVQVRLKLPGAWWHPDNVSNILALRILKANGWWDEYWQHRAKQWRARATELWDKTWSAEEEKRAAA